MLPVPLAVSRAVALLLVGLYAGGVFFVVIAPSLGRLPGPASVPYWQALNVDYGRAMPPLLLTTIAVLIVTAVLSRSRGGPVFWLTVAGLVLVVATVVLTLAAMDPLNRLADSWNPDQLPADWEQVRQQWAGWHLTRTIAAVAAFGCVLTAQALDRP